MKNNNGVDNSNLLAEELSTNKYSSFHEIAFSLDNDQLLNITKKLGKQTL